MATVVFFLLGSFAAGTLLTGNHLLKSERILIGFSVLIAIITVIGYALTSFKLPTLPASGLILLILIALPLILILRKSGATALRSNIRELFAPRDTQAAFLSVVFLFSICLLFETKSILPQGWDRGKHFADTIHLMLSNSLYENYPGTDYRPFYFEGPTLVLGTFMMGISYLVGLGPSMVESNLSVFSLQFQIPWAMLVCLWPLVPYAVVKRETFSVRAASLAALFPLTIAGIEYSRMGSIGTSYGHLLAVTVILIMILRYQDLLKERESAVLNILIIAAIVSTHVIPALFIAVTSISFYMLLAILKKVKTKLFLKRTLEITAGGISGILVLLLLNPNLFWGILDEIQRKSGGVSASGESSGYLSYIIPQLSRLLTTLDFVIFPFLLIGISILWQLRSFSISTLLFLSMSFLLLPLLPFPRSIYYMMTPVMALSALGGECVLRRLDGISNLDILGDKTKVQGLKITIIGIILIPSFAVQTSWAVSPGEYRTYSELDEERFHPLGLVNWTKANISEDRIIAFPNAGAVARIYDTLVENQVYFAEYRYSDLPQYQDIASIYGRYTEFEDRVQVVEKYNISVIIEGNSYWLRNVTLWYEAYPNMQSYVLFEGGYIVRILTR